MKHKDFSPRMAIATGDIFIFTLRFEKKLKNSKSNFTTQYP